MRISTWLHLAALCLIAGSLQATACAEMHLPVPEAKKPLLHEEFTGYGKTPKEAENDALKYACAWLEAHGGLGWSPDPQYLRNEKMVRFNEAEDKEYEDPLLGTFKVVKMQLDITANQARELQKQAQQQRMKQRQKLSLLVVLGVASLLGVVGGYLRLEEATKGYYTRLLRIAALGILLVLIAGLCVMG